MEYKNYVKLEKLSLMYDYYCFVDVKKYLADKLFVEHKVRVWFQKECTKPGMNYLIMFCKVRKKDRMKFLSALEELKNKMLIFGYTDYENFCYELIENILENAS